jgi:hypothetical protein
LVLAQRPALVLVVAEPKNHVGSVVDERRRLLLMTAGGVAAGSRDTGDVPRGRDHRIRRMGRRRSGGDEDGDQQGESESASRSRRSDLGIEAPERA